MNIGQRERCLYTEAGVMASLGPFPIGTKSVGPWPIIGAGGDQTISGNLTVEGADGGLITTDGSGDLTISGDLNVNNSIIVEVLIQSDSGNLFSDGA